MNEQILKDLVATSVKYQHDWDIVFGKFPELQSYDKQLLKDYVATAVDDNYNWETVNKKFPEFGFGAQAKPAPAVAQPDKKKVATALPSAASSLGSVSTRPTEPTIATRKPQTTSFGTYGVSKPQPSTAAFTKPVAPEPESILGPVEKDMSVKRDISVNPNPTPAVAPKTTEASDYFNKSLDIVTSDLVGLPEGSVVPKLNYTFGQYGFKFDEATGMFDEVKVTAPNGQEEIFKLDNFIFTDRDSTEATRLRKFISDNRPTSKLLEAREGQFSKPILEEKDIESNVASLNTDITSLNKDADEYLKLKAQLEAQAPNVQSMSPEQKDAFLKASNALELKRIDITRRDEMIRSKSKSLDAEVGKYTAMKAESGSFGGALQNTILGIFDDFNASVTRGISTLQEAVGIDNPVSRANAAAVKYLPNYRAPLKAMVGSQVTDEYKESLPLLGQVALGIVESAPAMIAGGVPFSVMQYSAKGYDELDKTDLGEGEKAIYATALAIPAALLEKVGFGNVFSEKLLLNGLLKRVLPKLGVNATFKTVSEYIEQDIKNLMARGVLRIGAAGAAEFETGAIEEIIDIGGKELIEGLKEKELFKTPENFSQGLSQVIEAGAMEAVGGFMLGSIGASAKAYKENKFENLLDGQVDFLSKISSDPALISSYKAKINEAVANGDKTQAQADEEIASFDKMIGQLNSIPKDISPAGQKEALRLLKERDALQAKIDISDPDLVTKEKARVAEIKEKLQKISTDYATDKASDSDFINSLADDEVTLVTVKTLEEVPEQFRDRAKKTGFEVEVRKKIFGLPIGAKTTEKINEGYSYTLTGKEIKDYAVQKPSTEESVLRDEESQVGLQEMGEGDTEVQAPTEEVSKEEVTTEPLEQKSSRLLDAIGKARELGADGVDALNSALANLRGIAAERINQIGNRIDDLQQKMRNITKASTIPSATMADLNGKQVNYNGEQATVRISEGGAVSLETPTQIVDLENVTPTTLAADAKVEVIAPAVEFNPNTDRYVDNDNVVINNVEYGINTNAEGNVVGLALKDGSNQVITNEELLKKAEVIRNTEGNVATAPQTMVSPAVQSDIDALNKEIAALEAERSAIEQETAEPVTPEATPTATEKRFAGSVLAATRVASEDLGKLVAILTKANKNVKVVTDKAKMVAFLVKKGLSPEQANQVKGVRVGDTVYINPDLATVDTPIHEFAHIWGELCKKQRPELWKRGISLITKSNYYKDLLARIKANPELSKLYATPEAIKEEALIQAIGERGAVIFDDNKLQLLWNNWVNAFDNFVKKLLGLPLTADITKIKLSEFLDMAATEVLTGKATGVGGDMRIEKTKASKIFADQVGAQQSANDLAKIIKDAIKAKLTKTQIVDILVKRGGLTAAEANQAYNDVKAGNAISIATTGTTPSATTTTVKPKTKFVDNIANAIEQMAGGNVAPEVKDAIVKEMNNARQAIKKALMSEMALKKQLASIVKSLGVSNKITAAQAKSIITAFSKVNVMSDSSVNNFIDKVMDIFDKVNAKTEAENRSSLINKIADLAKKAARSAVTSTGKTRAKSLDAVGQSFFKQVNKIVTLAMNNDINGMAVIANDLANAQNEINDAVQKELNGEQLTAAESDLLDLVYAFDAFGDMLNMSEAELQALLDDLKDAKSTSIQSMKAFRHKQALEKKNIVNATDSKVKQLNPAMFNADGSLKGQEQRKQNRKEIRNELNKGKVFKAMKMYINSFDLKGVNGAIRTLANTIQNIETLATILGKGKDKFFIKNIYDKLFVAEEKQRKGYQKNMNLMETLAKSVGFKNFDALVDALTTGRQYEFEVNGQKSFYDKDELLRMYALSKNEEQRAKLKKQGIDDNALAEIKTILGPELVSFADKVVDYLSNTYYDETNSVYVSEYNTRLPRVKDYFPTITERTDTTADILSGDLSRIFMADTASALKRRVDKDSDVILSFGFINALEGHFQQIERFKAYAPTVREINSTFSSPAFSAYLDETGTKKLFKFLVSNAISPDAGNPFPTTKSSIFDKYAGFALAFKLIQIPKQAISAVAAFEDYQFRKGKYTPAVDLIMFIKDLTTTIATLPKQVKKAREISASFNERYVEGMKGNVISTTSGRGGLRSLKQRSGILSKLYRRFKSLASLPTTFGDTLSVMGYMAVYNRNIKNGMDPEQAAIEFNNYNKTLQSRNAVDRTALQNNKEPLLKAFTMFGSSAFLQMNKVMQSSSAIVSKTAEYTKTRDASKLPSVKEYRAFMLNLGIANALFAWASYAFKILLGDDEDREKAYDEMMKALLGLNLLYQLPLLGDAIELAKAAIDGDELSLKGTGLNPYTTIAVKAIKGIKNDDYTQAAKPILELAAGMSFDPFIGLYEYFEGSEPTEESLYKLFGISKTYQPATSELTQEEIDAMEAEDKKQMKEFDPFLYESVYGEQEREEKRIKAEEKALKELYEEEEEY